MANNKIQLSNGDVLLDLTGDSVTPDTLLEGFTAHDAAGEPIVGALTSGGRNWELINFVAIPDGAKEASALTINKDADGNAFSLSRFRLIATFPIYTGSTAIPSYCFAMISGRTGAVLVIGQCVTPIWKCPARHPPYCGRGLKAAYLGQALGSYSFTIRLGHTRQCHCRMITI